MRTNLRVEMYYYTYAYLREDKTPYYIGKGKGNRAYRRRKTDIKPPKDKSRILILKQNLTEQESFKHEIYMIAVFGRKDLGTGILHNRTNGGEGASGAIMSDETRKKLSEANKGRTYSEETRKKMSESQKDRTFSVEHRRKLSEANKGRTYSEETRKKLSEANKNPSKETRKKMSEARKGEMNPFYGKNHSDENRRKISEAQKGKKWWNDNCGNRKISFECPGDGWIAGRGTLKKLTTCPL